MQAAKIVGILLFIIGLGLKYLTDLKGPATIITMAGVVVLVGGFVLGRNKTKA